MHTALYRAYRPEVFDQLLGQEHIVRILKNQIATGTTSHAYLFCGTRGTGKTTTARLLAKGLNCLSDGERPCGQCSVCRSIRDGSFLDIVEIDAASNRGIDEIRELRESVNYLPMVGRKKVYIIDEVHMLTTEAFNALLKTLEEPPEHVMFILATTEVQKLPATILSRCMRLDFKRIPEQTIVEGMRGICADLGIEVTEPALRIIAANADGSVRDGLSILDQCTSGGEKRVDAADVQALLGALGEEVFIELTDMVCKGKTADALTYLGEVLADGKDVRQVIRDWINHYRNLLMTKYIRDPGGVINLSVENIDRIRSQSGIMDPEEINRGILELSKAMTEAKWSTQPRVLLELCVVVLSQGAGMMRAQPQQGLRGQVRPQMAGGAAAGRARPAGAVPSPERPQTEPAFDAAAKDVKKAPEKAAAAGPEAERPAAAPADERPAAAPADKGPATDQAVLGAEPEGPAGQMTEAPEARGPAAEQAAPEPAAEAAAEQAPDDPAAEAAAEQAPDDPAADDLRQIWDDVFNAGSESKGSMYLIRSSAMLTAVDETTFTVTVGSEINRKHTENNRALLEDLMETRMGRHLTMIVEKESPKKREVSVEEAAASVSALIGTDVKIQ